MTMTGQEVSTRAKVEATYDTYLFSRIIAKEASLTLDQRFDAVLRNPDVMTLATLVDPSNHSGNGRTSAYPNYVWLFIGGLVGSRGSQRAVADWIRVPKNWFHFIDTICDAHGQHHRSNISSQPPSRTTIRHHNKRLIKAATTLTAVAHQLWIKQAQQQGCLNPNAGDTLREPARGNTVHGDGTVVKSPVRERKPHEKITRTASAATFYECGEDKSHPVFGIKYIAVSTRRTENKYDRVILRFERQHGDKEAEQGVTMIGHIQNACGGAIKAVAWDGALRGTHRQTILRDIGALPVSPPHKHKPRYLYTATDGTKIWTSEGALCALKTNYKGENRYVPLELLKIKKRANKNGTFRWYADYVTPKGLVITERLDQTLEDVTREFNRTEHLHPVPKGTPEYAEIYSRRPDAESLNNSLDSLFYRGRMIAYTPPTQDFAMFCFTLSQNSISRWVHNLKVRTEILTAA